MYLIPVSAFADNYLWLLHDGKRALVVDPGGAEPVLRALQASRLQLESILVTHHHADHTAGINALRQATGATVHGPAAKRIPAPFEPLREGDSVRCLGLDFQVFDVPGHTAGHIAFYTPDMDGQPLLFCGDTLFSGGCGRLFEGTPRQMLASLDKLAAFPAPPAFAARTSTRWPTCALRWRLSLIMRLCRLMASIACNCASRASQPCPVRLNRKF